jgi:hypothetical protein
MNNKFLASSANPNKVALTVKGLLVSIIPLLTVALPALGVHFDAGAFNGFLDAAVTAVQSVTAAVAAVMVVFGLARKAYYAFVNR